MERKRTTVEEREDLCNYIKLSHQNTSFDHIREKLPSMQKIKDRSMTKELNKPKVNQLSPADYKAKKARAQEHFDREEQLLKSGRFNPEKIAEVHKNRFASSKDLSITM